jgi:hypothetical protein
MKSHLRLILAAVCLLLVLTPAPAHAIIGGGWLERLSGPGPFKGLSLDLRLLCMAAPPERDLPEITARLDAESLGSKLTYPRENATIWLTGAGCHFLPQDQPRLQLGLEFAALGSSDNVLDYSNRGDLTQAQKKVNLKNFFITADIRVNRVLDVGAAFGRGWFSSAEDTFPSFSRTVTQPMRLTTRPLSVLSDDRRLEVLEVRFDATRFHGAFTAEDFGANPGTYREPGEIIWTWAIRADIGALLWR